jgi:hypothetical protein
MSNVIHLTIAIKKDKQNNQLQVCIIRKIISTKPTRKMTQDSKMTRAVKDPNSKREGGEG